MTGKRGAHGGQTQGHATQDDVLDGPATRETITAPAERSMFRQRRLEVVDLIAEGRVCIDSGRA